MPIAEFEYEHGDEADKERAVRAAFDHIQPATRPLTEEERCRLAALERDFGAAGGRGVELAEGIDELRNRAALIPEGIGPLTHDGKHQVGDVVYDHSARPSPSTAIPEAAAGEPARHRDRRAGGRGPGRHDRRPDRSGERARLHRRVRRQGHASG
jgi:hypothetical protein